MITDRSHPRGTKPQRIGPTEGRGKGFVDAVETIGGQAAADVFQSAVAGTGENVSSPLASERVVAEIAGQHIFAVAAQERVVSSVAVEDVVAEVEHGLLFQKSTKGELTA